MVVGGQRKSINRCVTFCTQRDKYKAGTEIGTGAQLKDSSTAWLEAVPLPSLDGTQNIIDRALDVAPTKCPWPPVTNEPMTDHIRHTQANASREPSGIPCDRCEALHVEVTARRFPHRFNLLFDLATVGLFRAAGILRPARVLTS